MVYYDSFKFNFFIHQSILHENEIHYTRFSYFPSVMDFRKCPLAFLTSTFIWPRSIVVLEVSKQGVHHNQHLKPAVLYPVLFCIADIVQLPLEMSMCRPTTAQRHYDSTLSFATEKKLCYSSLPVFPQLNVDFFLEKERPSRLYSSSSFQN